MFIDFIGPAAPSETSLYGIAALRRGGRMVNIVGMAEPLQMDMIRLMTLQISIIGSLWFSVSDGQDMAEMAASGTLELSIFEHEIYPLSQINEALDPVEHRKGGFTNMVVVSGS